MNLNATHPPDNGRHAQNTRTESHSASTKNMFVLILWTFKSHQCFVSKTQFFMNLRMWYKLIRFVIIESNL